MPVIKVMRIAVAIFAIPAAQLVLLKSWLTLYTNINTCNVPVSAPVEKSLLKTIGH
jgi:hypothetical protein